MGNQQKIKVSGDVSLLREVLDKRHRVPPSSHKDYVPSDKVVSKPPKVQNNGGKPRRGRGGGRRGSTTAGTRGRTNKKVRTSGASNNVESSSDSENDFSCEDSVYYDDDAEEIRNKLELLEEDQGSQLQFLEFIMENSSVCFSVLFKAIFYLLPEKEITRIVEAAKTSKEESHTLLQGFATEVKKQV